MHTGPLAFESTAFASCVFMTRFILLLVDVVRRREHRYQLWDAGASLVLSLYFGMLAVSSGPSPRITRSDVPEILRAGLLVASAFLAAWAICKVSEMVRGGISPRGVMRLAMVVAAAVVLSSCAVDAHVTVQPMVSRETSPLATPAPVIAPFITPTPRPLSAPAFTSPLPLPGTTSAKPTLPP